MKGIYIHKNTSCQSTSQGHLQLQNTPVKGQLAKTKGSRQTFYLLSDAWCCLFNILVYPERTNIVACRPLINQILSRGQENCWSQIKESWQEGTWTSTSKKKIHSSAKSTENIQPEEKPEEKMKSKERTFKNACLPLAFKIHLVVTKLTHMVFQTKIIAFLLPAVTVLFATSPTFWGHLICAL